MKKIYQIHVLFFVFAFFLGANTSLKAVNYSWNGAISTEWGNPSNWSPVGVPGSTDNVTINSAATNQPVWEESPGIQNLTMTNGTLNLAGFSISITGNCSFTGGTVTNGTLLLTGNSVTFAGSTINANVQYTGNRCLFNGGVFNGTVSVEKTGGTNDVCNGNCTFNNTVTITNQSAFYIYLANLNPDRFNQPVTFRALGNGVIHPARTSTGTQFNGNVIVASTGTGGVRFGQNGGTSTLASGKTITIGSDGFTKGELNFRGLTKNGSTPISITGTGTSRVRFEQNSTFNGKVTCVFPLIHMSGSTFNDTLIITKSGTGNISGNGGCTFNAPVYITKNNTGNFQFGDINPDNFQSDVYIDDNSGATGSIMLARSANGNVFAGDIYVNMNASGINFGANGGTSTLSSGKTIRLWNDGCTAGTLGLRYFTQVGTTPIVLTQTTGTATLSFQLNSVFNADVTVQFPNITFLGSTFNGVVTSTKVSASNNTSTGGNTFNSRFNLNVSGNGSFSMASASPDIFNGPFYVDNNSISGSISLGVTALGNQINGSLYLNNTSTGGIGFGSSGGTTTISAASDIAFFNDGYTAGVLNLRGITRLGTSGITLNQATGSSTISFLLGTTINGPVTITYPNISLDRAVFNGAFNYTKAAASNSTSAGGNTFNSSFTFTNAVGGTVIMANTYADIFNDVTTVNQSAASVFYFAHTATGNQFNGNILLNSTGASQGIRFGQNDGASTLALGKTIAPGASGVQLGNIILRNFVQTGATAQTFSQTTGTALLQLEAGCIFNGAVNIDVPQLIVNGTTFNSTAILKKNGAGNNIWTGSDLFSAATSIINTGSGYLQIGSTTSCAFNATATLSSYSAGGVIYMSHTAAGNVFNGDILLNSTNAAGGIYFGQSGGTSSLATGFRVMAGNDGITAGIIRLKNLTQVGATAQTLTATGTTSALYFESGSVFNAATTVSAPQVYLNGTNFANTLSVTQTGATSINSSGGCTFSSTTTLINSGTATWTLGNTSADIFQSTLTVTCSGVNSQINLAQTGTGNQFNGNIVLNSFNGAAGVRIGNNNGTSTLATTRTITVGASGFSAGSLRIRNLTQVGTTAQSFTVSGTAGSMYLESGNVFNAPVTFTAPQLYLNGSTFNGTSRLEQTSSYNITSNGGNTYNGAASLILSGTGSWIHANTSPDIFNSTLLARNNGTNILYLAHAATGNQFNGVVTFESIATSQGVRIGQGTAPTATIGTAGRFNSIATGFLAGSLRIRNVTQTGTQAHTLTVGGTTTAIYFETANTFTGATTAVAPQLYLNGTTFAAATLTQNGTTTTYSNGGNTFNGASTLNCTAAGSFIQSNISPDVFNSTLALNCSGAAAVIQMAFNGVDNVFAGTITMTSTGTSGGIRFGQGTTGTARLTGTAALAIGAGGFTSGSIRFRRFVQTGTAALTLSNTTAAVQAYMETGTSFNGVVNFNFAQHFLNGATFNGTTTLQNNGTATVSCLGGNVFNGTTTINCSGTGEWRQATTADDDYNGNVSFRQTTAAKLYPAYTFNALFSGNVTTVGSTTLVTFTPAANAGRVVFDGGATQTLLADAGKLPVIPNLEIAKSAGTITPGFILTVSKALFMTSGTITTSATNYMVLNDNVTATVASASSYVNGPIRKIGNDAFTFPVGKAGYYRPISIGAPSNVADHFTAEYFMSNSNATYSHSSKDASINHISTNEYWILNRTGGTSNVIVTLSWDAVSGGVNSSSNLRVVRWNGSMWKDHGNGGMVGQTIGTSGAVTSFSPFTLASNNNQNPLPVELLSFKAEAQEKHVQLDWSTASEINNHFFTVERSLDLITYEKVAEVKGAGNSNTLRSYAAIDASPINGISYYRLVQTDYDGTRREYDPQMVQFNNESSVSDLNVYPNPFDQQFTVKLPAAKEGNYTMNITDATGNIIGSAALKASDLVGYEVNLQHYMPGIYTVQIVGADLNLVKRVVKKN